jgi:hypothetical protein
MSCLNSKKNLQEYAPTLAAIPLSNSVNISRKNLILFQLIIFRTRSDIFGNYFKPNMCYLILIVI